MNYKELVWVKLVPLGEIYQIMFKLIILSQFGAHRYQKLIFEILLLSPLWSTVESDKIKALLLRQFQKMI